ncbi:sugar phosphate nucleotidyltransferase [Microlunatus elymi]|nr:sugar phosphate nucleotidyltransferase [Microlunatus elymi]
MSDLDECAVVLTAGYGSRLFPVTAVVQKSLMPILNYPVLHYVLADLVAAGVRDIAIVVDQGDRAIGEYVTGVPTAREELASRGWARKYQAIEAAHTELAAARFTLIEQDVSSGDYGTAVPASLAAEFVGDRCCFYSSGDDLLLAPVGGSNTADVAALRAAADGCAAAMQVARVPAERKDRYGMVELEARGSGWRLGSLTEKSSAARGSYANISRYYLTPEAFRTVCSIGRNPETGERMITDALVRLQQDSSVGVSIASGSYYDCGSVDGWHEANVAMHRFSRERPADCR